MARAYLTFEFYPLPNAGFSPGGDFLRAYW
jgi:hypothetical protein